MDLARTLHFFFTFFCETPLVLLSFRFVRILRRSEYRNHSFCRIFIASFIVNSFVFFAVLLLHRIPGMGIAYSFYASIASSIVLWPISLLLKTLIQLSFLLSFLQSLNRMTSLVFARGGNQKIWRYFESLILPGCIVFCILLNVRVLEEGTKFEHRLDNRTFVFTDRNHKVLYGSYWLIIEGILDLLCNIFVLYQFLRVSSRFNGSSAFENSLFIISFCSFATHSLNVAVQLNLREQKDEKITARIHLVSNICIDAAILLPTVFIMAFTREVREEAKRSVFVCARAV